MRISDWSSDVCSSDLDRPAIIATRTQAGHWEADAMLFSITGHAVLIAHERHSRLTIALRHNSPKAAPVAAALVHMLETMPAALPRPINFQNETEFNHQHRILTKLETEPHFSDHSTLR